MRHPPVPAGRLDGRAQGHCKHVPDPGATQLVAPYRAQVVACITEMSGPPCKRIGDAMAGQTRAGAETQDLNIDIPAHDRLVLNRHLGCDGRTR